MKTLLLGALLFYSQTSLTFEAVSIHRNPDGGMNTQIERLEGGRLRITNASLKTLIRNAYDLQGFQFAGGPKWLDAEMYNIEATTGHPERISEAEFPELLKSLLADRFHLKVHWEPREATVYTLLIDKAGSKIKPSSPGEKPIVDTGRTATTMHITGVAQPISDLTQNLGNRLQRIVIDKTGLAGNYDFAIEWDAQSEAEAGGPSGFTVLPSVFAVLKDKLGLRLEAEKGQVRTLVVDDAEKVPDN